jgi:hypothetical protein
MFEEYRLTYVVEIIDCKSPNLRKIFTHRMIVGLNQEKPNKREVRKMFRDFKPILFQEDPSDFNLFSEPNPLPTYGYGRKAVFLD